MVERHYPKNKIICHAPPNNFSQEIYVVNLQIGQKVYEYILKKLCEQI